MAVTVIPETFTMVHYDHGVLVAMVSKLVDEVGLAGGPDVVIEVDERIPLGRVQVRSLHPLHLEVEGGAFEDPKRPRQYSPEGAAAVLGRYLRMAADRLDPAFGGPALGDEISLPQRSAWEIYAAARMGRLGYHVRESRWRYAFRNRHGFTDVSDRAFDRLWTADDLTWADVQALSDEARAASGAAA
jgi:hypothetical protein